MQDVDIGGAFDNVEDAECAVAGAVSDLPHALADVGHGLPVARIRALLHKSQIRTGFHAGTCRKAAQVVQRCADPVESFHGVSIYVLGYLSKYLDSRGVGRVGPTCGLAACGVGGVAPAARLAQGTCPERSEEHTSDLQTIMGHSHV